MATLNLSSNGPSITKSYQSIVNAGPATGAAALSPTYGQWAVYSVAAPLVSAFQQDSGKESVLKVQSTGEGELLDLIDEFSDGRIQFAFVRVKDPNTTLPKCVLVAWCGEGVPERTKGYFTSHLAAVSKLLHGYHVQVTARSDRDLTPEGIIQKVADSSGSKYSGGPSPPASNASGPPLPSSSKPAFMPTKVGSGNSSFNVLGSRSRTVTSQNQTTDNDGWG
ncbi:actin binding protein, partial [Elasticomyces elasticus]